MCKADLVHGREEVWYWSAVHHGPLLLNRNARGLMTLNLWKAFATIYPDEAIVNYFVAIDSRPMDTLENYRTQLSCQNLQWLTCLTLANVAFSRAEMMNLSRLHSLVALDVQRSDISYPDEPSVDDSIIRNWGRRAQENEGFPRLHCLILRNQRDVTVHSLQHLNHFPALALYGVIGCGLNRGDEDRANSVGWTTHDQDDSFRNIQRDMELSYTRDRPILHAFQHAHRLRCKLEVDAFQHPQLIDTPVLNFRIGALSTGFLLSEALVFFRTMNSTEIQTRAQNPAPCVSKRNESSSVPGQPKVRRKLHIRAGKQVDLHAYLYDEAEQLVLGVRC